MRDGMRPERGLGKQRRTALEKEVKRTRRRVAELVSCRKTPPRPRAGKGGDIAFERPDHRRIIAAFRCIRSVDGAGRVPYRPARK